MTGSDGWRPLSQRPRGLRRLVLALTLGCALACLLLSWGFKPTSPGVQVSTVAAKLPPDGDDDCGDVLRDMLNGSWVARPLTPEEDHVMRVFYKQVREVEQGIPRGVQRADRRCGNVNVGITGTLGWFRALCDAHGPTPCCYGNRCVNRTKEQCACEGCFDMRVPLHAEYSTWTPVKPACKPREWPVNEACALLRNSTVVFIGDSLLRHVFTALLLTLRGDPLTGAFSPSMPPDVRKQCRGLYMFSEKVCRVWLDGMKGETWACNGTVALRMRYVHFVSHKQDIDRAILSVANRTRSLVVMGLGFHDKLDAQLVQGKLLQPLLSTMASQRLQWPRLLWADVHRFGIMRTPLTSENNEKVARFNRQMGRFLSRWRVPQFDTWPLTTGVMSFDGQHYGYGVNSVKVRVLLHYVRQLQRQGRW